MSVKTIPNSVKKAGIDVSGVVTMLAFAVICLILLALFVRGITSGRGPRPISEGEGRR